MYQGIDIPRSTSRLGHTFNGRRMQWDLSLYFTWIMQLKVTYNPINERNIFTNGDTVTGRVTLEVRKSGRINSLSIKFIVVSRVQLYSNDDPEDTTYHSEEKHFLDQGKHLNDSSVVAPGCYVYPFSFQIPLQDLPASYHSSFGKIQYKLEAKLSRSMKRDEKHETEITFVPTQDLTNNLVLMKPQRMTAKKNFNSNFNSGKIEMGVKLEKSGFFQGEWASQFTLMLNLPQTKRYYFQSSSFRPLRLLLWLHHVVTLDLEHLVAQARRIYISIHKQRSTTFKIQLHQLLIRFHTI
ncbi:uncharacterized protein V6R79_026222 [Siganus canaliculatus]